jgi:hypothetical protein
MIDRIRIDPYEHIDLTVNLLVDKLNKVIDIINFKEEEQLNCGHVFIESYPDGSRCLKCGISPYEVPMKDPGNRTCYNCFYYLNACGHVKDPGPCIMWSGLAPR